MKSSRLFYISATPFAVLLLLQSVCHSQRNLAEFEGKAWEEIERQRDSIEVAIIGGEFTEGLLQAGSALFMAREEPAFQDLTTSLYRAYCGIPPEEAEALLDFRLSESEGERSGLGWCDVGLLAKACDRRHEAVNAFQEALKDETCCEIPLVYALLGESFIALGRVADATEAFGSAIEAASGDPTVLFQVRKRYAETLLESGLTELWLRVVQEGALSKDPLERAWGLQQSAQDAWREGDFERFSSLIHRAVESASEHQATHSPAYRFEHDQWNWLRRHLGYATDAIAGSSDAKLVLDYEAAIIEAYQGRLHFALDRLTPWLDDYPIHSVEHWDEELKLWGQRLHLFYNNLLGRLGFVEEAVAGFHNMFLYVQDTAHLKFEPHIYCHLGYVLSLFDRHQEALNALEMGLSVLDVPGQAIDPNLSYHRHGRIGKKARLNFVRNYRSLLKHMD